VISLSSSGVGRRVQFLSCRIISELKFPFPSFQAAIISSLEETQLGTFE